MKSGNRPLSPFLMYRPEFASILSFTHRLTGIALAAGTLFFTHWLTSAAYGPEAFARAQAIIGSVFGRLLLFGWTLALFYHLCNGIRHLAWDAGWGFELPRLKATGWVVIVVSITLTFLSWAAGYAVRGGA